MSTGSPAYRFNGDGESVIVASYDETDATQSVVQQLQKQVEPGPNVNRTEDDDPGGVVRRSNEFRSQLGPAMLESIALAGMELSKSVGRRARDLYRNKFPLLLPAFECECERCEARFDDDSLEECPHCEGELRDPDPEQRAEAAAFFRRVNREGQSLSELYQELAADAGRLGGWVHIVRYNYGVLAGAIMQEPVELVRADSKTVKPVVDEDGRIGGYWWACPIHRETPQAEPGECEQCGAQTREVYWAEVDGPRSDDVTKLFFEDEVVDFAAFNGRLAGHDWVSPVAAGLWKRQAILEWMNSYAAAFFDDKNTDRFPGRLMILHTTNRSAVEKQLKEAQDERDEDPYANGVLYNEIPRDGNGGGGDAQVLDLMNDDLMGQSPDIKKDFKSDIRSVYGQVDAQDSELEDAGGLNNEGLQLTVSDDALASWQQSLKDGPLAKLMRVMGWDDWKLAFVPPDGPEDEMGAGDAAQAAATAEQAGLAYAIEDGRFRLADTDGEVEPEPEPTPDAGAPGGDGGADERFAEPSGSGGGPDIDIGLARQAVRNAVNSLDRSDAIEGARWIGQAYDEMFTPGSDESQAVTPSGRRVRSPEYSSEKDVPEFAEELLDDAIRGGAIEKPEALTEGELPLMEAVVRRNLVTEGRWTVKSVADDIHQTVNVEESQARIYAVNAIQNVVQAATQLGYMVGGDLDEREFYLGGPDAANTCEACSTLLDETNPGHGGSPMQLDDLIDKFEDVAEDHGNDPSMVNGGQQHVNCIHRLVEHREARTQ